MGGRGMRQPAVWSRWLLAVLWTGLFCGTASADHLAIGRSIVSKAGLVVRVAPSLQASSVDADRAGVLGTVRSDPVTADGYTWLNVDFEGGLDGWVRADQIAAP